MLKAPAGVCGPCDIHASALYVVSVSHLVLAAMLGCTLQRMYSMAVCISLYTTLFTEQGAAAVSPSCFLVLTLAWFEAVLGKHINQ